MLFIRNHIFYDSGLLINRIFVVYLTNPHKNRIFIFI